MGKLVIRDIHLPVEDFSEDKNATNELFDVVCEGGRVLSVEPSTSNKVATSPGVGEVVDGQGRGVLLPAFEDKCDELVTGDFAEALRVTEKTKRTFSSDLTDLYERGKRLITESVECGVTAMRAHVEVDSTVGMSCLNVGLRLKEELKDVCDIQIAVFAQDPVFGDAEAGDQNTSPNRALLDRAAGYAGVEVIGSAPYVEPSNAHAKRNIAFVLDTAAQHGLHADFHLDYNLDPATEPLIWNVLEQLRARIVAGLWRAGAHVCIGHATRLTLFSAEEWSRFRQAVHDEGLPITLVGLPQSDMYMMGRGLYPAPRGTLDVPQLAREHGLRVAMAVNNIENAFTPQGPVDPLALCPLGVALFQGGTRRDCRSLMEAVTLNARSAIGMPVPRSLMPAEGDSADFVLVHGNDSLYSAALNPSHARTTIKHGEVVATRRVESVVRLR